MVEQQRSPSWSIVCVTYPGTRQPFKAGYKAQSDRYQKRKEKIQGTEVAESMLLSTHLAEMSKKDVISQHEGDRKRQCMTQHDVRREAKARAYFET